MNALLERRPWACGAVLGTLLGALVLGVGARDAAPDGVAMAAAATAGLAVLLGIGLLGRQARALAETVGQGKGAARLLGTHPWRTGLVAGAVAGVVRGAANLAVGSTPLEAGANSLLFFVLWVLVLGLLGQLGVRRPEDHDRVGDR